MIAEEEKTAEQGDRTPAWERDPVTIQEACEAVLGEAYDIESMQRALTGLPGLTAPGPTAMRKAYVFRYAATVLQIVHENSEEFKRMISQKRIKAKKQ